MAELSRQARIKAVIAHLLPLVAYLFIAMFPFATILAAYLYWHFNRQRYPFVEKNAREVLNFHISFLVYIFVGIFALSLFIGSSTQGESGLFLIGMSIAYLFFTFGIIVTICATLGAVQAWRGEIFWYPANFRLIK